MSDLPNRVADSAAVKPPHRHRSGKDAPINDLRFAFSVLPATLFRGACPNCRNDYMYENWWKVKPTCDFCGVRFERDPGSFLVLLGLNYLVAIVVALVAAWVLIANYGLFNGLTWVLVGISLVSLVGLYHFCKSSYIWMLWVTGFVYND